MADLGTQLPQIWFPGVWGYDPATGHSALVQTAMSLPSSSPAMAACYSRGAEVFRKSTLYYEDTRDVYWHFQGCRNPRPGDYHSETFPSQADPAFPNHIDTPFAPKQRLGSL
jgi:hypothetical protein